MQRRLASKRMRACAGYFDRAIRSTAIRAIYNCSDSPESPSGSSQLLPSSR